MRLHLLFICIILATSSVAQQIDRPQADSLLRVLNKAKSGAERIIALIKLAEYHVFKPGENQVDLDSATACLEEAERLNKTIQSTTLAGHQLLIKGFMLREKGQKPEGRQAVEQAVSLLEKGTDKYLLGKAYFEWQGYYSFVDAADRVQRILITQKAVDAFQQAGEMEQKGHALRMLGELYVLNREFNHAKDALHRAVAAYDSANHRHLQGVYNLISRNYYRMGDFKPAIQYGLQALKTAQAMQDSSMELAAINNTLGILYRIVARKDLAIRYFRDGLAIAVRHSDTSGIINLAHNASLIHIDLNEPRQAVDLLASLPPKLRYHPSLDARINAAIIHIKAYLLEGRIAETHQHAAVLEKLLEEDPDLHFRFKQDIYQTLTGYYLKVQNVRKARLYIDQCFLLPQPLNSAGSANRLRLLYKVDSAERNYTAAFDHLNDYKKVSDSLFNETKFWQMQQLEVEFETSKKGDSILLLTQKTELQTANLRRADLIKNFTIAGILLALLIIGLLYRQYQLKQNSNKVISQKNERLEHLVTEKEWLLKEVHHRVKNNLQTIMSLLELQLDTVSKDAQFAIQTSQNRIYTTSLLHQKLYRSENLSSVNMQVYLTELIQHLRDTYGVNNDILFTTNIAPVELDVTQGVPIGLIVNEVVTNSLKYAFNQEVEQPVIIVSLTMSGDIADLLIADNGTGFLSVNDDNPGLGLKLVKGLAQDIDGHISITADNGASVLIRFKPRLSLANSL